MMEQRILKQMPVWLLAVFLGYLTATGVEAQELLPPRRVEQGLPPPKSAESGLSTLGSGLSTELGLDDLIRLSLERNPRLRQVAFAIEAAQGRALQAGLYPNPRISVEGEEIGPEAGIQSLPQISQEIVTAGKLRLSRAVANREVGQAELALLGQRYALFTTVRQGYFEVLALQRRVEVLDELLKLVTQFHETARKLLKGGRIAELDVLPFEIEQNRVRTDLEAARRERVAAWNRLAARVGVPLLPLTRVRGSLEVPLPQYDLAAAQALVLEVHPAIQFARVGVERAQLALRRQEVEPIPNVTLAVGYQRNFNDRENQALFQVGVPIPLWNRNQGNIQAARAELSQAVQEVDRVRNDLLGRLSTAFGLYSAARQRAERYRTAILPAAEKSYRLSLNAFRGGQFEYLRVLQAQRTLVEANLIYVAALADAWQAASEIAGLLLEEDWPLHVLPGGESR
jgi:cobalt-zinc-cadmium efflux system outer membrane protein